MWTRPPAAGAPAEETGVCRDVGLADVRVREDAPLDVEHVLRDSNWKRSPLCFCGRVGWAGDGSICPMEGWPVRPISHEQLGQGVVEHAVYRSVQRDPVRGDARALVVVNSKWGFPTWRERGRGKREASGDGSDRSMQHWGCEELCGRIGRVRCSHCSNSLFVICGKAAEFWGYLRRFLDVSTCGRLVILHGQNEKKIGGWTAVIAFLNGKVGSKHNICRAS